MAIAVFIQFIAYQAFNYIIDYSLLLGSSTPSRIVFNVFRSSGITAEPAIHSGIMIGLISLHFILLQRISLTTIIALISIFITFSIAGIVMALFYIIVVFSIKLNLKKISIGIITLSIAIAFSYPYLTDRYTKFVNNQDGSNNTKIETIKNMVTKHEILIGGYGLTGKSITAPPFYEGLYDMTFWGTSIVIFGLPMGLLIDILGLITISRLRFKLRDKALIIISLLKITAPTFMFFNIFIVLIFAINYQYKNEKRKITI
ncbi:hypothetical protein ACMFGU_00730 [Morganella morganii]|uniref:hypothetical protein n=1 Tax=Morganella morganii TaxID=582 RepID=UPI003CF20A36|nr:hypothetical protein [Morganella morganii]HCR3332709.1 hypothetical protein [Morganella morganii]